MAKPGQQEVAESRYAKDGLSAEKRCFPDEIRNSSSDPDDGAVPVKSETALEGADTASEDEDNGNDAMANGSIAGRVLSRLTSRSSVDPRPPPDGGWRAWSQCRYPIRSKAIARNVPRSILLERSLTRLLREHRSCGPFRDRQQLGRDRILRNMAGVLCQPAGREVCFRCFHDWLHYRLPRLLHWDIYRPPDRRRLLPICLHHGQRLADCRHLLHVFLH